MQDGNFVAENLMQVGGDRRRETDFGTSRMAERPASSTARIPARYTAVLPEPVTPCSRIPENFRVIHRLRAGDSEQPAARIEIEFHATAFAACRARPRMPQVPR